MVDRWVDGRTEDEWTDWTDRRKDRWTDGQMGGWTDGWNGACMVLALLAADGRQGNIAIESQDCRMHANEFN